MAFCIIRVNLLHAKVIVVEEIAVTVLVTAEPVDIGEIVRVYLLQVEELVGAPFSEPQSYLVLLCFCVELLKEKLALQSR